MEDENNFCFDGDKAQCLDDVRIIGKDKYPISNRGISETYFRLAKSVAVNTDI